MKKDNLIYAIIVLLAILPIAAAIPANPENLTVLNSTSKSGYPAATTEIEAGNVTAININADTVTNTWAGVYGNISGTIRLEDASGSIFYSWNLNQPAGEVYAATSPINFDAVINSDWRGEVDVESGCFPYNISGNNADGYFSAGTQTWGTAFYGLHELENDLGLNGNFVEGLEEDSDGVNETFRISNDFPSFYVGTLKIDNNAKGCPMVHTYVQNSSANAGSFHQLLLYDNSTHQPVYVGLINKSAPIGFDNKRYQFQMLLGENGHANVATTTYYFYTELE